MPWARLLALLALALCLLPAPARALDRTRTVLITVAAPPAAAQKLGAVAGELLSRLELEVELRQVDRITTAEIRRELGSKHPYRARAWVTFGQSGQARLYLEHSERDRILLREVAADTGNPELVREELGHILQTAIEGLEAGEELGRPRAEALQDVAGEPEPAAGALEPAPAPAPVVEDRPEASRQRRDWRFGPRYEIVWLGDESAFEDGPGAVLGWVVPQTRYGFELAAFYRRPLMVDAQPVGARLQTLAFRALVSMDAFRSTRSVLRLGVGAGADFVRVSPLADQTDIELAPSGWLSLALGRLTLSYAHELAKLLDLELTLGIDVDPLGTHYVYATRAGEQDVLAPWPVRPLLSLGATVP